MILCQNRHILPSDDYEKREAMYKDYVDQEKNGNPTISDVGIISVSTFPTVSVIRKKTVLFLVNRDIVIYNFRQEIVERLIADGHEVHISSPYGERIDDLVKIGAVFHDIDIQQRKMNPIEEIHLMAAYKKLMEEVRPDIVFGFTIKPNTYGAIAARKYHIPFVANITGLGTAVENPGIVQKALVWLYKYSFRDVRRVFFQNTANRDFFLWNHIRVNDYAYLPGSGVNLDRFPLCEYPKGNVIKFAFVSRILKEKGSEIFFQAARVIRKRHRNVEFHVCGFLESDYDGELETYQKAGDIIYHGLIRNVASFMEEMHCIVLPSYYPEGISNVLLEACAIGRPIITTDRAGCREVVEDGLNGYMIPQRDTEALIEALETFLKLSSDDKQRMGLNARHKVEREYDRQVVVEAYVREVEKS